MCSSSGRAIATSTTSSILSSVGAQLPEVPVAGRARRSAPGCPAESVPSAAGEGLDLLGRALAHRLHRVRQQRGVGLGVRGPEHPDGRLPEHVVERDPGPVDRAARRAARRGRAPTRSRSSGGWSSASAISSAPRSAAAARALVGERRVQRLGAVRERVHRRGAELRPRARWSSPRGPRSPATAARPMPPRLPGGQAVDRRSSAPPRAWSGSPPPRAPRTAAIPFAESITRPPPRATSRSEPTSSSIAAAASGTGPAGTRWTRSAASSELRRLAERPLGGEQLEPLPVLRSSVPTGSVIGPAYSARLRRSSANRSHRRPPAAASDEELGVLLGHTAILSAADQSPPRADSNPEPLDYKSSAPPVELGGHAKELRRRQRLISAAAFLFGQRLISADIRRPQGIRLS